MKNRGWGVRLSLSLAVLSVGALAGCAQPNAGVTPTPSTMMKGALERQEHLLEAPQILNLPLSAGVTTLDPSLGHDEVSQTVSYQLNEGLVRIGRDGKAVPGVAKDWRQDGLTYTFTLREQATWSDGSALTAHDFEFAWKRTLDPRTQSKNAPLFAGIKGVAALSLGQGTVEQVAVHAQDARTLVVTLESPLPYFVELTAMPPFFPQKEDVVAQHGAQYGTAVGKVLTNGPFRLESWTPGQLLRLMKNEQYWDRDRVRLEVVDYMVIADPVARLNLYEAGQIDRTVLTREAVEPYKSSTEFAVRASLACDHVLYNEKVRALASSKVRRALTYAVDATTLADTVYRDGSRAATGFVPQGLPDGQGGDFRQENGDVLDRKERAPTARSLYQEGLRELGLSTVPTLKLLALDDDPSIRTAEFLREAWRKELGASVEIERVQAALLAQREREGRFDMVLTGRKAGYSDPMAFLEGWVTQGEFNAVGYSNAAYDEHIHRARQESNPDLRMQSLYEAEKILASDMPLGPLVFRGQAELQRPFVRDFQPLPLGPRHDLKQTYIEEG